MLKLFPRALTFFALAAAVVVAPACDAGSDAELAEQLGVSVDELDAMSADELDELDRDLSAERVVTHHPDPRPRPATTELGTPIVHTHHGGVLVTRELDAPTVDMHTTPGSAKPAVQDLGVQPEDPGCDTHGDDALELAAP